MCQTQCSRLIFSLSLLVEVSGSSSLLTSNDLLISIVSEIYNQIDNIIMKGEYVINDSKYIKSRLEKSNEIFH